MTRKQMLVAAAMAALLSSPVLAQRGGPPGGRAGARMPLYDTTKVENLSGVIERIDTVTGPGMAGGVHLQVRTKNEAVEVHAGPGWYLEQQKLQLAVGDRVELRGSRVTWNGKPVVLASEVTRVRDRERATVRLRDQRGIPAWSRGRPRRP